MKYLLVLSVIILSIYVSIIISKSIKCKIYGYNYCADVDNNCKSKTSSCSEANYNKDFQLVIQILAHKKDIVLKNARILELRSMLKVDAKIIPQTDLNISNFWRTLTNLILIKVSSNPTLNHAIWTEKNKDNTISLSGSSLVRVSDDLLSSSAYGSIIHCREKYIRMTYTASLTFNL